MATVADFKAVVVQPYGGFPHRQREEYVIDIWTAVVQGDQDNMYYIFGTEEFGKFSVSRNDINGPNIFTCDTFGQVIERLAKGEGPLEWLRGLIQVRNELQSGIIPITSEEDYGYYSRQLEVVNAAIADLEKGGK